MRLGWEACATTLFVAWVVLGGCHRPPLDSDAVDHHLLGEVMMHGELAENLRALCMPGGRLSGSENGHKAERYVAQKLRDYGFDSVHFEPFNMTTWRDRETVVTVLDDPPQVLEGALSLGNCLSTPPEGITAEVVYAKHGTEEQFEEVADRLDGKFALVREGNLHRAEKMKIALRHGAAGALQVSSLDDRARVGVCHSEPRTEPGVVITGADGARLIERIEAGETVRLNIRIVADAWEAIPNNVVGEIPGTGPLADEIVILGAHLDSWHLAEGAIDNGNGASSILETARALATAVAMGWQPKRTVRIVWFMGEEHGLFGSKAYVKAHADELDDIVAVVNIDMPGAPRKFHTFGHPEVIEFLQSVRADLAAFEIDENIGNATWTASDHAPFMKQGVCAIGLSGDLGDGVKFYHSSGDMYEVVDRRGTIQSSAVLAVLVRRLADCPRRPTERYDPAKLAEEMGWKLE